MVNKIINKILRIIRNWGTSIVGSNKDLILVYTMSKVGSSTVYYSLKHKFPGKEIHHLHFMGDTWLNSFETGHPIFKNNLKTARRIKNLMQQKKWNIKIITLTRDPIARDVSGIFQAWQHIFDVDDVNTLTANEIVAYLEKNVFDYPSNWFETDFKEFTGVDIYKTTFNKTKGYSVLESDLGPILILQVERLNEVFTEAMRTFFGKGKYPIKQENITADRSSGILNKNVKNQLKLPTHKLNDIYSSPYCTTFYTDAQITQFKKRWSKEFQE